MRKATGDGGQEKLVQCVSMCVCLFKSRSVLVSSRRRAELVGSIGTVLSNEQIF